MYATAGRPAPAGREGAAQRTGRAGNVAGPVRLTRRGRMVVTALAALMIGGVSMVAASAAQATSHRGPAARGNLVKIVVRPGQDLWSIAEASEPDADTRAVIEQIRQLNSLSGYQVAAWETLWVPKG
jgi:hypothetical protein